MGYVPFRSQQGRDVVIALGAGLTPDGRAASPQSAAVARRAIEAYHAGWGRHLLFVGGYGFAPEGSRRIVEATAMARLAPRSIPSGRILIEAESLRTWQNAAESRRILLLHGWWSAYVFVHEAYAERAARTFRRSWQQARLVADIVPVSAPYGGNSQGRWNSRWRFRVWNSVANVVSHLQGHH